MVQLILCCLNTWTTWLQVWYVCTLCTVGMSACRYLLYILYMHTYSMLWLYSTYSTYVCTVCCAVGRQYVQYVVVGSIGIEVDSNVRMYTCTCIYICTKQCMHVYSMHGGQYVVAHKFRAVLCEKQWYLPLNGSLYHPLMQTFRT